MIRALAPSPVIFRARRAHEGRVELRADGSLRINGWPWKRGGKYCPPLPDFMQLIRFVAGIDGAEIRRFNCNGTILRRVSWRGEEWWDLDGAAGEELSEPLIINEWEGA